MAGVVGASSGEGQTWFGPSGRETLEASGSSTQIGTPAL